MGVCNIVHQSFRRRFIAGSASALAGLTLFRAPAKAAQYQLKCGVGFARDRPTSVRLTEMWKTLERESDGRIHVQYFTDAVLGGDTALLSQLRLGALDFMLLSPLNISTVVPVLDIAFLGFAFRDADEGLRVMKGPLGAYLRAETVAKGIYAFREMWGDGMIQVGSVTRPIRNPDDLRGFKIRVPESRITVDFFKELGANSIALNANELYTALQTKLVDGQSAPLVTIQSTRLYEVNKYVAETNHQWNELWLIANANMVKGLPLDLQAILERVTARYAQAERRGNKIYDASLTDKLTRQGLLFNKVDQAPFRARLGSYYQNWANTFGPTAWGLLESSLGHKLA
jgi:TRAP-type transport system periplasmic protein